MRHVERFVNGDKSVDGNSLAKAFEEQKIVGFLVYDPIGKQTCEINEDFRRDIERQARFRRCMWLSSVRTLYLSLIFLSVAATLGGWIYQR